MNLVMAPRGPDRHSPQKRTTRLLGGPSTAQEIRSTASNELVHPLHELAVPPLPLLRDRDALVPVRVVLEDDEAPGLEPREVPEEDVVVHVRRDLQAGLDHRFPLPPQALEETGDHEEGRALGRGGPRAPL